MSTPQTSATPTPLADSGPVADGLGRAAWVADSIETTTWINGLTPSGATVFDTGWVTLTTAAGYTATQPVQVRRVGLQVMTRGLITPTTNWGAAGASNTVVAAGGLASELRASQYITTQAAVANSGTPITFRFAAFSDGSITIACDTASSTAAVVLGGVGWFV